MQGLPWYLQDDDTAPPPAAGAPLSFYQKLARRGVRGERVIVPPGEEIKIDPTEQVFSFHDAPEGAAEQPVQEKKEPTRQSATKRAAPAKASASRAKRQRAESPRVQSAKSSKRAAGASKPANGRESSSSGHWSSSEAVPSDEEELPRARLERATVVSVRAAKNESFNERLLDKPARPGAHPKWIACLNRSMFTTLKGHQINALSFLWQKLVLNPQAERGCILAHEMGLGKTLVAICFAIILEEWRSKVYDTEVTNILVICPKTVIPTWLSQIREWSKKVGAPTHAQTLDDVRNESERAEMIEEWRDGGGILLVGYEMFRNIMGATKRAGAEKQEHQLATAKCVILDEGHRLSKIKSKLSKALSSIPTRCRLVLTGTPLQNNLNEYFAMIEWVRPGLWSQKEFNEKYTEPIRAGQHKDSSAAEVQLMKKRAFFLNEELSAFVHRRDAHVLLRQLPAKSEFAVHVPLTDFQLKLQTEFLRHNPRASIFMQHSTLVKIANHPQIFFEFCKRVLAAAADGKPRPEVPPQPEAIDVDAEEDEEEVVERTARTCDLTWATEYFDEATAPACLDLGEASHKLQVLLELLRKSTEVNEKVLVFSQFTQTLDLIQQVISDEGFTFCRIDGTFSTTDRTRSVQQFKSPKTQIMLVSTRAGGLGLNLVEATRVIVFDVSWNPAADSQAIARCWRFGQTRPVFVYRLVAEPTSEEIVYRRQTTKGWLFHRVVDDRATQRNFRMEDLDFNFEGAVPQAVTPAEHKASQELAKTAKDSVLAAVLEVEEIRVVTRVPQADAADELTAEEKKDALIEFQRLKQGLPEAVDYLSAPVMRAQAAVGRIYQEDPELALTRRHNFELRILAQEKEAYMHHYYRKMQEFQQQEYLLRHRQQSEMYACIAALPPQRQLPLVKEHLKRYEQQEAQLKASLATLAPDQQGAVVSHIQQSLVAKEQLRQWLTKLEKALGVTGSAAVSTGTHASAAVSSSTFTGTTQKAIPVVISGGAVLEIGGKKIACPTQVTVVPDIVESSSEEEIAKREERRAALVDPPAPVPALVTPVASAAHSPGLASSHIASAKRPLEDDETPSKRQRPPSPKVEQDQQAVPTLTPTAKSPAEPVSPSTPNGATPVGISPEDIRTTIRTLLTPNTEVQLLTLVTEVAKRDPNISLLKRETPGALDYIRALTKAVAQEAYSIAEVKNSGSGTNIAYRLRS
eukprot:TRINITY_DN3884_c0_g1_i1.p1 TRINITY_DN3884_c0_g1~~TRINITY_DN3884_c0_g1_i1.p1  ORF type:complete len:1200 (+),score=194.19 TRINITY_DN3884_c0_g1_i1:84-3683(+)